MKRLPFSFIHLAAAAFILTSCSTVFSGRKIAIRAQTKGNIRVVSVDRAIVSKRSEYFVLYRSADSLRIKVQSDSVLSTVTLPPKRSSVYWSNVLNLGMGFFADKHTPKKYIYTRMLLIEKKGDVVTVRGNRWLRLGQKISKGPGLEKGTLRLSLNFPWVNSFQVQRDTGFYTSHGFMGLGLGLSYAYADNRYLTINAGTSTNFAMPFPAPIDYIHGRPPVVGIRFLSLKLHRTFGQIDVGYGVHCSVSRWSYTYYIEDTTIDVMRKNVCLGPSLKICYFNHGISVGLVYQPSFFNFDWGTFINYQHFITLELGLNCRLRRPRDHSIR